MSKKNRRSKNKIIQDTQIRVPNAIRRGIIEGFSFPYVELQVQEQVPEIKVESSDDDPITYYKEIRGSGLFAIRSLKS